MRKVFFFMMTTLDGYFEGEDHDISWHNANNREFAKFADDQLDETDTLIFGRRTYELMAEFWPSEEAIKIEPSTASRMNSLRKVVFSRNPISTDWHNVESSTNVVEKMQELKSAPGKDIAVLGSSNLSLTLIEEGLLDEIRIMINPLIIGKGTQLLDGSDKLRQFTLKDSRTFKSGNVLLTYTC
ncbi:MAG: dihydrofolate reductase family protein [Candidatus Saccharimonadales bacterium]